VTVSRAMKNRNVNVMTIDQEIAHLRDLDLKGLQARWQTIFRKQAPAHLPRHLLFGILAYRVQADQLGDLDKATAQFLKKIGSKKDVENLGSDFDRKRIEVRPGTILMREWNGKPQRVMVLTDGFAWNDRTYDSLSKVAFAITGTRWNGPRFFGLRDKTHGESRE
jgi:hypothetical protein